MRAIERRLHADRMLPAGAGAGLPLRVEHRQHALLDLRRERGEAARCRLAQAAVKPAGHRKYTRNGVEAAGHPNGVEGNGRNGRLLHRLPPRSD